MRKNILAFLVTMILLSACSASPASSAPTPTVYAGVPTPTVAYQIIGGTDYTAMVVVDPASNADRKGLLEVGDYLCTEHEKCRVWFWDDINKADSTYPIDPEKEPFTIAYYSAFFRDWDAKIKVYTLGDPR